MPKRTDEKPRNADNAANQVMPYNGAVPKGKAVGRLYLSPFPAPYQCPLPLSPVPFHSHALLRNPTATPITVP